MALQKQINTAHGIAATYFKVVQTNIDWKLHRAYVLLQGFLDKAARDSGKTAMIEMSYEFKEINSPAVNDSETGEELTPATYVPFPFAPDDNVVLRAYTLIKARPEWADAADV